MKKEAFVPSTPAETKALVRATSACTPALVAASTVAVVAGRAPLVRQIGTGTLLAVGDAHFVVTAAHVLVHAEERGMSVGISGSVRGQLTALPGTWMVTSAEKAGDGNDPHDVALFRLGERELSRLGEVKFVRIGDVSFERDLSNKYFVVSGFPGMWSTESAADDQVMQSKLLQYGTYAFQGSSSGLLGYDPDRHFLLEASPATLVDHEGEPMQLRWRSGHSARMPDDLAGISGCSVWAIGDFRNPVKAWSPDSARIVGIETSVFPRAGAIKATRWNAITTLLHGVFPDLRRIVEWYAEQ